MAQLKIYAPIYDYIKFKIQNSAEFKPVNNDYDTGAAIDREILKDIEPTIQEIIEEITECLNKHIADIKKNAIKNITANLYKKMVDETTDLVCAAACDYDTKPCIYTPEEIDMIVQNNDDRIHDCTKKLVSIYKQDGSLLELTESRIEGLHEYIRFNRVTNTLEFLY